MARNKQDLDRFFEPWKFANQFGIPEVQEEDIEILEHIGSGGKGSTSKAKWNGQIIALKSWHCNESFVNAASYWEVSCYNHLKAVQGSLIPKLHFISRSKKTGRLMLGLELGEAVSGNESGFGEAKHELESNLRKEGWRQRYGSWRVDNLVWMKNEDGRRRLVAIDLESFIPYFGSEAKGKDHRSKCRMTPFGIPEICPAELELHQCDSDWEWTTKTIDDNRGTWRDGRRVKVLRFCTRKQFETEMERYDKLGKQDESLISRPLFIARQRDGAILLGMERFKIITCTDEMLEIKRRLKRLGWDKYHARVGKIIIGGDKRHIVYNLKDLKEIELDVPEAVATDDCNEELSSSGSDRHAKRLKIDDTLK